MLSVMNRKPSLRQVHYPSVVAPLLVAIAVLGCVDVPAGPNTVVTRTDFQRSAFVLTLDPATGAVQVGAPPAKRSATTGVSYSLLSSEVVQLHAGNCTWTQISRRIRRCTIELRVENRMPDHDLVTPTTFPSPSGLTGVLVLPYAVSATPVGTATPSSDWDNGPINFFNDVCSAKSNDCIRSESFSSPLYSTETSDVRTVGFDVDADAQSVTAYILVGADLRYNPQQEIRWEMNSVDYRLYCTSLIRGLDLHGDTVEVTEIPGLYPVGRIISYGSSLGELDLVRLRLQCGVVHPNVTTYPKLAGKKVRSISINILQDPEIDWWQSDADPYPLIGPLVVDHMRGFSSDTVYQSAYDTVSTDRSLGWRQIQVLSQLLADSAAGDPHSTFVIRFAGDTTLTSAFTLFHRFPGDLGERRVPYLLIKYSDP
jgi:hypothetical protein